MSPLPDHAEHVQERAEAADDATLAAELRLCMVSGVGPLMRKKFPSVQIPSSSSFPPPLTKLLAPATLIKNHSRLYPAFSRSFERR
jgi:hypothetical protein